MPYLRQRPRIPATGKIGVRLNPGQRDLLLRCPEIPQEVGHFLHRAPVRKGKLEVRVGRAAVDAMIAAAVKAPAPNRAAGRALDTFVRYLEGLADRFEDPEPADEAMA